MITKLTEDAVIAERRRLQMEHDKRSAEAFGAYHIALRTLQSQCPHETRATRKMGYTECLACFQTFWPGDEIK